ncbi:unnamed protein product [Brachionus calyciflorus]|uniref:Uncharacterized protein n=1 Tax=Brachionus calyciflorus TaxID=104777 RepID=A0A814KJ56_9BILA|nr:unnamed protein product [Brachionus calyciflorus]
MDSDQTNKLIEALTKATLINPLEINTTLTSMSKEIKELTTSVNQLKDDLKNHTLECSAEIKKHTDKCSADLKNHTLECSAEIKKHADKCSADLKKHSDKCSAEIKKHIDKCSADLKKHSKECKESIDSFCDFNAAIRFHNSRLTDQSAKIKWIKIKNKDLPLLVTTINDFKKMSQENVNKFLDYYGIEREDKAHENILNLAYHLGLSQVYYFF